ncbi:TRAP transporter small permease [Devosia sp. SD17-2]|jgi:TRAP-type C4-dicarboxylate transport system permease small subunit|uniref:TRAP transporter small permease subunit n=1 Tax=Devosia sp. SD17-2 TaxID=2976459 RepID=UPI0023D889AA|nr:TRAP transporter small permease [Devosia sp. SD17-2]WEJ34117.1 TRAP transporter small permease [Devosia sp. SD17-2]
MSEDPELVAQTLDDDNEIRSGLDRIVAGSTKFFAWAIFLAFAVSVIEVVARYVFGRPTFWAHETTTFLIAAIFLIGGPIALARDKHIRVRIFYDSVSPQKRRWFDIINSILALAFFGGLSYAAWIMSSKATFTPSGEFRLEGTGTAWNPPTPALLKILVLICCGVMFVQTVLHLVEAIRRKPAATVDASGEQ